MCLKKITDSTEESKKFSVDDIDEKPRFGMDSQVEATKNLVPIHNITAVERSTILGGSFKLKGESRKRQKKKTDIKEPLIRFLTSVAATVAAEIIIRLIFRE